MPKAAIVILAGTEGHDNLGRVVNALVTAKDFKDAGEESTVIFDGGGTAWVPELAKEDHRVHSLYQAVEERIAGACAFCSNAFGVRDEVEGLGVPLLDDYAGHPSIRSLVADGFQVITF